MVTPEEKSFILEKAYVPEHSLDLMTSVSEGEPFLRDGFFFCRKGDWVALVGYPVDKRYDPEELKEMVQWLRRSLGIRRISMTAPQMPRSLGPFIIHSEKDQYYMINLKGFEPPKGVLRLVKRAERELRLELSSSMNASHWELSDEFSRRSSLPPRIRVLLNRMPQFVGNCPRARVINAWNRKGQLVGFYVVDMAPESFSTYVIGCYSKERHVPGASDLLLWETVQLGKKKGKEYIHLGLGVNEGIRRFKIKWGARPFISYEMADLRLGRTILDDLLQWIRFKA